MSALCEISCELDRTTISIYVTNTLKYDAPACTKLTVFGALSWQLGNHEVLRMGFGDKTSLGRLTGVIWKSI